LETRRRLLRTAWDQAAPGYERYFLERFAPWLKDALTALLAQASGLPSGPVLVPCCGPGQELLWLADALPGRRIWGIDLSAGMVERARQRTSQSSDVHVEQGDAASLSARFPGSAAAVFSSFGLQQLPDPRSALEDWGRCLAAGGALSVVFWPPSAKEEGPAALLDQLIAARLGQTAAPPWELLLPQALAVAGAALVEDRVLTHTIHHESPERFFDELVSSGSLRAMLLRRGEAFMAELRQAFLSACPRGLIEHRPQARLLVAKRAPPLTGRFLLE
jgi:SAM-dependent methyltransferase